MNRRHFDSICLSGFHISGFDFIKPEQQKNVRECCHFPSNGAMHLAMAAITIHKWIVQHQWPQPHNQSACLPSQYQRERIELYMKWQNCE